MPIYEYDAIDKVGKKLKGTIDADSVRLARSKLRAKGIYPRTVKEGKGSGKAGTGSSSLFSKDVSVYFKSDKISVLDLAVATRQLSTLVGAGLPLVSAMNALTDQIDSQSLRRIMIDVRENIEEGLSLSKAMAKFPKAFPRLYISMISAGEASGTLDTVLEGLANHLESQLALRSKIRSALIYPIVMLIFCSLVLVALFVFVIPNIVEMFQKQNLVLPLPTRIMITISNFLIAYWWSIPILVFLAILGLRWYYRQENGRKVVDHVFLQLPIFSSIYLKIATARVSLTLGALLKSGVQLLQAIDITKRTLNNVHLVGALEQAHDGVREGKSLAGELRQSRLFPSMLCHMIAVGEKSGSLETMLSRAGGAYETEVNNTLEGLTALLEPLMMIGVGLIVLMIVLSVLLPFADLINMIQT